MLYHSFFWLPYSYLYCKVDWAQWTRVNKVNNENIFVSFQEKRILIQGTVARNITANVCIHTRVRMIQESWILIPENRVTTGTITAHTHFPVGSRPHRRSCAAVSMKLSTQDAWILASCVPSIANITENLKFVHYSVKRESRSAFANRAICATDVAVVLKYINVTRSVPWTRWPDALDQMKFLLGVWIDTSIERVRIVTKTWLRN